MRAAFGFIIAILLALPALSEPARAGEEPLSGDQIQAALSGNTAFGEQDGAKWKQYFAPDGTTTYIAGDDDPSPGQWRVDGDTFCSLWPPATSWDCYDMTGDLSASPPRVTWIYQGGGDPWPAEIRQGNRLE